MSDDAQTPEAQGNAAPGPTPTRGAGEPADAPRDPWAAPGDQGSDRPEAGSTPWPTPPQDSPPGPGMTVADAESVMPPVSPPSSSVHDQQTVTSMPGVGGTPPHGTAPTDAVPPFGGTGPTGSPEAPQPWSSPRTPSAQPNGEANPFAPPNGPGNPFAPIAPYPAAPYGQEQVPPPPIAPGGPGQAPYGYPGGYGYPAPPGPGYGSHAPHSQGPGAYYGWPGMAPAPNNGMGTAAMIVGIISAVGFCMWPIAIIGGIVAVVLGVLARQKARRGEATNAGQALAGIICGSVGLALAVGMIALLVFVS
ncbi:DUF4190 domain-containing protein [Streptomyces sp. NBC_01352]|uniref:DUF4190 domain-containing protein n=1 Tax=Streptomyces sp. NBC_01352 TaxID=2903834 RepID=UPI002E30FA03|nr:DUF4190 domain-containing protein [Streptomyces sp. NBC_01352]